MSWCNLLIAYIYDHDEIGTIACRKMLQWYITFLDTAASVAQ